MYFKLIIAVVVLLMPLNGIYGIPLNQAKEELADSTVAIFVVLGILDEYMGRPIIEGDDTVEEFYPLEGEEAFIFASFLNRIINENDIQTTLITEITESEHIRFHSVELVNLINEYYNIEPWRGREVYTTHGGSRTKLQDSYINSDILLKATTQEKLSYLLGAYLRYGNNNSFRFSNAIHKVKLIVTLLIDVGCKDVRFIDHSRPRAAPYEYEIKFVSSSSFEEWIKIYSAPR